jgi:preprotein translocase SecE subunit
MADIKKKEDPKFAAARAKAEQLAKAGPVASPAQFQTFINETASELKKTTWPDRDTLTRSTYVVLGFIALTLVWVFVLDFLLGKITAPLFGGK